MNAPRDLSAVLADLGTHDVEPWRSRLLQVRNRIANVESLGSGIWRGLPVSMREMLVSMATDRTDPEACGLAAWGTFSDTERQAIGALARTWLMQLQGVERLR